MKQPPKIRRGQRRAVRAEHPHVQRLRRLIGWGFFRKTRHAKTLSNRGAKARGTRERDFAGFRRAPKPKRAEYGDFSAVSPGSRHEELTVAVRALLRVVSRVLRR